MEKALIQAESIKHLKSKLSKAQGFVIVDVCDEKILRAAINDRKVRMILNVENSAHKDFMHARNSGLNQVICKILKERDVIVGFSFDGVYSKEGMERAIFLGRMMQNAKMCRKFKVKTAVVDFKGRDEKDLNSFGVCIGLTKGEFRIIKC
ncbi:hypothetical protein HY500_01440 [Candidatus Woesearchaeota archaeon]|nr:hypothetical protein [Candidatus Woesearchaeota archaeon]